MHRRIRQGAESVFRSSVCVDDLSAAHDIGVHINRVNRICHQNNVVLGEDIPHIACIALGAIVDHDLIRIHRHAEPLVIAGNCLSQESIALIIRIALEGLLAAQLIAAFFHSLNHNRSQRQGHIPDAKPDQMIVRMLCYIPIDPFCNFRKQIVGNKIVKILIYLCHIGTPLL